MKKSLIAISLSGFALLSSGAYAHHSFAMFDMRQDVTLKGTVREFQWTNPHSWIQLTVVTPNGSTEEWSIETMSPGALKHLGWKRDSVKAGDMVIVKIHPLKNGQKGGDLVVVQSPAGTFYGLPTTDPNFRPSAQGNGGSAPPTGK